MGNNFEGLLANVIIKHKGHNDVKKHKKKTYNGLIKGTKGSTYI